MKVPTSGQSSSTQQVAAVDRSAPTSLSVSVVIFQPDLAVLRKTFSALTRALNQAQQQGSLGAVSVHLVDNGSHPDQQPALDAIAQAAGAQLHQGHGNLGYGLGHNRVLLRSDANLHLVLNPDVILDPDAIHQALRYIAQQPEVIMLAPRMRGADGQPQYLCKRYPSVLDLALRGLAPAWLRRLFDARLAHYELRDLPRHLPAQGVPLLSGSFMLCRRAPVVAIGGFSPAFFVYFEDFDLSLRAAELGELAYVPSVTAVHLGGQAARKGWRHILLFARGAATFFRRHGWRWR